MLVQDLITGSMRLINAIAAGDTPSASELNDGLAVLQELIDSWNTEQLTLPQILNVQQALTAGVGTYTMGVGGAINSPRPLKIQNAGFLLNGIRQNLEIVSSGKWSMIPEKFASANLSLFLYNDNAYPLVNLHLWPVPSGALGGNPTLDLFVWSQLQAFVAPTDTFAMPPGYLRALRFNLAIAFAAEFGAPISQEVMQIAMDSKQNLTTLDAANALAKLPTDLPSPPPAGPPAPPQQGNQ